MSTEDMKKLILKYWYTYAVLVAGIIIAASMGDARKIVIAILTGILSTMTLFYYEKWRDLKSDLESAILRTGALEMMLDQNTLLLEQLKHRLKQRVNGLPVAVIGHRRMWVHLRDCLDTESKKRFVHIENIYSLAGREFAGVVLLAEYDRAHLQLLDIANTRIRHRGA